MSPDIVLIPQKGTNTPDELKDQFPDKNIFACDFYLQGAEDGALTPYGLIHKDITNIDHHSSLDEFTRRISSTNLAIAYITQNTLPDASIIVLNHTDCDSILTAMILSGELEPKNLYGNAAIMADHYGTPYPIADLLQAIEHHRDINLSKHALNNLLNNEPLDPQTLSDIAARQQERAQIQALIEKDLQYYEDIAYITLEQNLDAALFPPYLPEAKVIVIGIPMEGRWKIKARLGNKTEGIQLNTLDLPDMGGRWNAISTGRNGGTQYTPKEYAQIIYEKLDSR